MTLGSPHLVRAALGALMSVTFRRQRIQMRSISSRQSDSRVGVGSGDTGSESLTGVSDSLGIRNPVLGPNPETPDQAFVVDGGRVHLL